MDSQDSMRWMGHLPEDGIGWVTRVHLRELTRGEKQALCDWLSTSSNHRHEYVRAEAVWRLTGGLAGRSSEIRAKAS